MAQATRAVMRSARARSSGDAARSGREGGVWGVFLTSAADVATGRRVAGRDRRPGLRAKLKTLDRVLRRDAFCIKIIRITPCGLPGASKGPPAGSAPPRRRVAAATWVGLQSTRRTAVIGVKVSLIT